MLIFNKEDNMANYSVVNSAVLVALLAFSSQADEISNSFESPFVVSKKNDNRVDEINTNGSINALLEQAAQKAISSSLNLCEIIDKRYIELINSPEKLSDNMYIELNKIRDIFVLLDTLFKTAMAQKGNINSVQEDNQFDEAYRNYKIVYGKFNKLLSLAKQIKVVPTYFESDIDFNGLKELTEYSTNRILAS